MTNTSNPTRMRALRKQRILEKWDTSAQLEAITEFLMGRPEKFEQFKADLDSVKAKHKLPK